MIKIVDERMRKWGALMRPELIDEEGGSRKELLPSSLNEFRESR